MTRKVSVVTSGNVISRQGQIQRFTLVFTNCIVVCVHEKAGEALEAELTIRSQSRIGFVKLQKERYIFQALLLAFSNPYLNELLGFLLTQMFLLKVAQKV